MISRFLSIFKESMDTFEGQEKGEQVIFLLRRHPFVAFLPVSAAATMALIPILGFLIFYSYIVRSGYFSFFLFLMSLYYMLLWVIAFYHLTMYTLNTVIVTDKRIIDRDQLGFFDRKVSELHVYRIQDVTVSTKGILPTMLGYGDVMVQTAGIEQSFVFHEMPNPEEIKTEIMKVVSMANASVKPHTEHSPTL
jgi:uncharacterized membrane protein YdbT with pleckstrin-like domain